MINCNRRDGSARAVNEVAERLAGRGHEIHLYARRAEDLDLGKIRWHHVPGLTWPEVADFATYYFQIAPRLHRRRFDIIHSIGCNSPKADVITIQNIQPAKRIILQKFAALEKVSPFRRATRGAYLRLTSMAERRLYTKRPSRRSPMFLPVSRGVETELRAHYQIGAAPVRIIPNGADTSLFRPLAPEERICWRKAHGLRPADFISLFSGGEWARKGLDLAMRALALVKDPRVKLFVAGDDPDRRRYFDLAQQLELNERVIFGGFRQDIATALASSDLFLFPSWYEAFSLATIEAAACGLPVFAAKINGTEDFIRPGETGEFLEHDARKIADVLNKALASPERLQAMGMAARKVVEENYTWEHVAKKTEDAYKDYLSADTSNYKAK